MYFRERIRPRKLCRRCVVLPMLTILWIIVQIFLSVLEHISLKLMRNTLHDSQNCANPLCRRPRIIWSTPQPGSSNPWTGIHHLPAIPDHPSCRDGRCREWIIPEQWLDPAARPCKAKGSNCLLFKWAVTAFRLCFCYSYLSSCRGSADTSFSVCIMYLGDWDSRFTGYPFGIKVTYMYSTLCKAADASF